LNRRILILGLVDGFVGRPWGASGESKEDSADEWGLDLAAPAAG